MIPNARWVAGFKTVPAADLSKEKPETPTELYSDDKDALEKIRSIFEQAAYPIGKLGDLEGSRHAEVYLLNFLKENVSCKKITYH